MKSLVSCRIFFADWHLDSILFDATIEWLVLQSVVSRRQRKVCTTGSQLAFQFCEVAPQEEQTFL